MKPTRFDFTLDSDQARDSILTSTNAISSMIDGWMQGCFEAHTACRPRKDQPSGLPTRLLDLDASVHGEVEDEIHLYISNSNCDRSISYVALSHCWGADNIMTLTKDNLESFRKGIPVNSLPQTFQDSVKICRKLRVRYLWIDSLCIIQDDPEDWVKEAGAMSTVYANCIWSLAALHATSSAGGCFAKRDPRSYLPCKIPGKIGLYADVYAGQERSRTASRRFQGRELAAARWEDNKEFGAPLLQRAWALQERMLAPRTIYFGSRNVHWECRTRVTDDISPTKNAISFNPKRIVDAILDGWNGAKSGIMVFSPLEFEREYERTDREDNTEKRTRIPRRARSSRILKEQSACRGLPPRERARSQGPKAFRMEPDTVPDKLIEFSTAWSRIVALYGDKSLTSQKDKLQALQGIVDVLRIGTGLTPFFGMWEESLFDDLLWKRRLGASGEPTNAAPSF